MNDRAQKFRDRAKTDNIGRPNFKFSRKYMTSQSYRFDRDDDSQVTWTILDGESSRRESKDDTAPSMPHNIVLNE